MAVSPSSFSTVTVNVCGSVMPLVAFGAMLMRLSTNVLVAGPLSPDTPSPVARVSGTPLTLSVAVAFPITWPAVAEVKVTRNWPPALVVPESGVDATAFAPLVLVRVTVTPAPDAGPNPV